MSRLGVENASQTMMAILRNPPSSLLCFAPINIFNVKLVQFGNDAIRRVHVLLMAESSGLCWLEIILCRENSFEQTKILEIKLKTFDIIFLSTIAQSK